MNGVIKDLINGRLFHFMKDAEGMVSYCFLDSKGELLKSINNEIPLVPASNMKLVTSITAMDLLGKNHTFKTNFLTDGKNMHVFGDPSFFLNNIEFRNILERSKLNNPDAIYLESPKLDKKYYNDDWVYGDSKYCYQPKITDFFINENCKIKEGLKFDEADFDYLHRNESSFNPVRNPDRNFLEAILGEDGKRKVVHRKRVFANGEKTISLSSPLSKVLQHILYESCNFYAEVIFKYLSSTVKEPGSWEKSSVIVKNAQSRIKGIENVRIVDGSGLSRDNYLTTEFLSNLLLQAKRKYGMEFIKLLPTSGIGTLRKRLSSLKEYEIYAKTGSLFGVSSLSGYIKSLDVEFSIIINNSLNGSNLMQEKIDKILMSFIKEYEKR